MKKSLSSQGHAPSGHDGPAWGGKAIGIIVIAVVIATGFLGYKKNREQSINKAEQNVGEKLGKVFSGDYKETPEEVEENKKHRERIAKKPIIEIKDIENIDELVDGEYKFNKVNTSNWKTYRNEDIGIEMKIPKDWVCVEDKHSGLINFDSKYTKICLDKSVQKKYEKSKDKTSDMLIMYVMKDTVRSLGFNVQEEIASYKSFEKNTKLYKIIVDKKEELLASSKKTFVIDNRIGNDIFMMRFLKQTKNSKIIFDGIIQTLQFIE